MSALFSIKINKSGVDEVFSELFDVCEEAVKPAAAAGSQVLFDQVQKNVARIGTKTGKLADSIYQVYSKDNSGPGFATYHISWNVKKHKAPHGHLLEYGWIQRYEVKQQPDGAWVTLVRPEKFGKPAPKWRGNNRAEMDAYYLPRRGGPVQWLGHAFIRGAHASHSEVAMDAAQEAYVSEIGRRWGA